MRVAMDATKHVIDIVKEYDVPTALCAFESAIRFRGEFARGLSAFVGIKSDKALIQRAVDEGIGKDLGYRKIDT
jgi:hypothetical protein